MKPCLSAECWPIFSLAFLLALSQSTTAAPPTKKTAIVPAQQRSKKFPEGVTPDDVFAKVNLLNRSLDVLYHVAEIKLPNTPKVLETQLGPMHVYQMHVGCIRQLHEFAQQARLQPMPLVYPRPMKYAPVDIAKLTDMMQSEIEYAARRLKIAGMPKAAAKFTGKTSTDIFQETVEVFFKLSILNGHPQISTNIIYSELASAVGDAKSILAHVDPACRYSINVARSQPGLKPTDVFRNCLVVRREINAVRRAMNLGTTAIPTPRPNYKLTPVDVFLQTQIIIAELNLLKLGINTLSSTPLAVPVIGKVSSDCHQQAAMVKHLVEQMKILRSRTATSERKQESQRRTTIE